MHADPMSELQFDSKTIVEGRSKVTRLMVVGKFVCPLPALSNSVCKFSTLITMTVSHPS